MVVVVSVALAVAGCGGSQPRSAGPGRRAIEAAFHGSPPALAALRGQADALLDDPSRSIETSLRTIEGTPQTFSFNARGREEYDHGGPYTSVASLQRDIRTYLGVR